MNDMDCNVVRDLMPLCIDGASSAESQKVVVDHVRKCEKCAMVYRDMQERMQPEQPDDTNCLDAAARKLHRKRMNRKRIMIALTCVITAMVVLLSVWGYEYATSWSSVPVALDEYEAYLTRTRKGEVLLNIIMKNDTLQYGLSGRSFVGSQGGYAWEMEANTTLIRKYNDKPSSDLRISKTSWNWVDGAMYHISPEKGAPIEAYIMVDDKNERVLYQHGDDIQLCSEELEAYYDAWDAYHDYDISENRRKPDFDERREELKQKAISLGKLVPEFQ